MDNEFLTWSDFSKADVPYFIKGKSYYYLTDDAERGTFDTDEVDEMIEESQEVKKWVRSIVKTLYAMHEIHKIDCEV